MPFLSRLATATKCPISHPFLKPAFPIARCNIFSHAAEQHTRASSVRHLSTSNNSTTSPPPSSSPSRSSPPSAPRNLLPLSSLRSYLSSTSLLIGLDVSLNNIGTSFSSHNLNLKHKKLTLNLGPTFNRKYSSDDKFLEYINRLINVHDTFLTIDETEGIGEKLIFDEPNLPSDPAFVLAIIESIAQASASVVNGRRSREETVRAI